MATTIGAQITLIGGRQFQVTGERVVAGTLELTLAEEVVHRCPFKDKFVTSCCERTPFELPSIHRMTTDPALVTCGKDWGGRGTAPAPNYRCRAGHEALHDDGKCHAAVFGEECGLPLTTRLQRHVERDQRYSDPVTTDPVTEEEIGRMK